MAAKNETSPDNWEFIPGGIFSPGNYVLAAEGFYVSYNPSTGGGFRLFASDDGGAETALVRDGKFLILNGDYRADYERLAPEGYEACERFYRENCSEAASSWSDDA